MQIWMRFYLYANLNETLPICPDGSNCTQVWMKLFQLPNVIEAVGIFPNVSNCRQISTKHLYISLIRMKLFEVHKKWIKLFQVPQKWIKAVRSYPKLNEDVPLGPNFYGATVLLFDQCWFSLLEFTQIFPIYGNISNFTQVWMKLCQFSQTSLRLLKFTQMILIFPNLSEALIVNPDISKCTKISKELFHIAQLWTRCLKLPTIESSCCKLPKFDLTDGIHANVSNLSKRFYFHPNLNEAFLICPDFIEAVGPYPNALNLLKYF